MVKLPFANHENRRKLVDKAVREAEVGRQLAIYDRQTGLLAPWYFAKRADEEIDRAIRYERFFKLLLVELPAEENKSCGETFVKWLGANLRASDLSTHLGSNRYMLIMPDAELPSSCGLEARLRSRFPESLLSSASFPADGDSMAHLRAAVERRLV